MDGCLDMMRFPATRDRIAVLVLDGFSALSLGTITEPFAIMRQEFSDLAPDLHLVGLTSRSVRSASGVDIVCGMDGEDLAATLFAPGAPGAIIVCGPTSAPHADEERVTALLRRAKRSGVALFGVGRIAAAMADAGLLNAGATTVHWKSQAAFREECRTADTCNALFVADRRGGSCAGETATLDLILDMIATRAPQATEAICNHLLISHPRVGSLAQPGSQQDRLRGVPPLLSRAARFMADEIEDPLSTAEIADRCGVSVRQLQRMFQRYLGVSPMHYYTTLKVERAKELVTQTGLALQEVAFASGFASSQTFAKKFKKHLGVTPQQLREKEAGLRSVDA